MSSAAASADGPAGALPSPWIMRFAEQLAPGAEVLDLACGEGRHARALAARGCRVEAIDRDIACGQALAGVTGVRFRNLDLESGPWPLEPDAYDAIVVANYLHRPRLALLARSLRKGGLLIYETFAHGQQCLGRPTCPDYLLAPFELAAVFAPLLHVLAFEDGLVQEPRPARVQRLCAIRADRSRPDQLALPAV